MHRDPPVLRKRTLSPAAFEEFRSLAQRIQQADKAERRKPNAERKSKSPCADSAGSWQSRTKIHIRQTVPKAASSTTLCSETWASRVRMIQFCFRASPLTFRPAFRDGRSLKLTVASTQKVGLLKETENDGRQAGRR